MLSRTFQHIPGIGETRERELWSRGIHTWQDFLARRELITLGRVSSALITSHLERSLQAIEQQDLAYFFQLLPSRTHWRLIPQISSHAICLDIETTAGSWLEGHITTVGIFDGQRARAYVHGQDLHSFAEDIRGAKALVTYNGKTFDVPWVEQELGVLLPKVHIDLRYVFAALGYRGGLKAIEQQVGMGREGVLSQVDGLFAIYLWSYYKKTGDIRALQTLMRYNLEDVVKLRPLLHLGYNQHLDRTPFEDVPRLPEVPLFDVDIPASQEIVSRIRQSMLYSSAW